ncbi:hypothetical protein Unana1_04932 [Umbelopsis nana]
MSKLNIVSYHDLTEPVHIEYNSSQPMDIELDEDEVIEIIKPVLQNLQLAEDSSTQLSQKLLTDNLLALLRLPYYQLSIACERLDFSPWPDDRMVIICDVISSHPDVSHQNVLYVLKNTVYQRIQYMETTPSRYFTNSIIQMAKSNGDSAIDGIIRPLLHSSHQNKVHSDLITKVVSSGLQWDSSAKLLSGSGYQYKFPKSGWNDAMDAAYLGYSDFVAPNQTALELDANSGAQHTFQHPWRLERQS